MVGGLAAAATAATTKVISARRRPDRRRHVLTVFRPYEELSATDLPAPLADLGDAVVVDLARAPGGRGTEISVRAQHDAASASEIRRALHTSRSLLEAGDVLLPSGPPTTKPTLRNRALRQATRHGRDGGLL
jgi:hypothetical protein